MLPRWLLPGAALLVGERPAHAQSTPADTLLPAAPATAAAPLKADSTAALTLGQALRRGTFGGHVRTVFMATLNRRTAPDYYAHGVGAGLQLGLEGFFLKNLYASPLAAEPGNCGP